MAFRPTVGCASVAVACMCATLGLPAGVRADPVQSTVQPISDVLVRGRVGPALWRVTKGGSELVILGSMTPTPAEGRWNSKLVEEALRSARVLLLSPGSTPGLAWAERFHESQRYLLGQPFGRTLAKELDAATDSRLNRMAAAMHQPDSRYSSYRPGPAGMILLKDSWRARGLTGAKVDDAVIGLADAAHVKVVKVDEGGALPLIDAMPSMSKAQHAACVSDAMDQVDREGDKASAGFDAWANADLATLRVVYQPLSLCMDSIPGGPRRREAARAIWLKALAAALDVPGRAVAIMDVSDLLEPSDLLAALRAQGATVTSPRAALTLEAASKLVAAQTPAATEIIDLPGDLRQPAADLLQPLTAPPKIELASGRAIHSAQGDVVCVEESSTGTFLLHKTCHTPREWSKLEARRSLNQVRDLRTHKAVGGASE